MEFFVHGDEWIVFIFVFVCCLGVGANLLKKGCCCLAVGVVFAVGDGLLWVDVTCDKKCDTVCACRGVVYQKMETFFGVCVVF